MLHRVGRGGKNQGPANMAELLSKNLTRLTFLFMIVLGNKMVAHTFLPPFDIENGCLCQERLLRSSNLATMVT